MKQQNISFDLNELLNPVINEEKKQINIFYEYLLRCSKCEIDKLVEIINEKQINKIIFSRLRKEKRTLNVDFGFLNKLSKQKILQLAIEEVSYNDLIGFNNLELLSINLDRNQKLFLNNFKKLNHITLSNYTGDNVDFSGARTDNLSIMFYGERGDKFNYILPLKKCSFLNFRNYTEIDFNGFNLIEVDGIDIYGCKKFVINNCGMFFSKIKKMYLEKCDLSFFDENLWLKLIDLKELYIDNCKNLKSLKGISSTLNKIKIINTKIEDCDVSFLEKIPNATYTKYKEYIK